ncbi:MAG TPA: hypothetical protein VLM79_35240, partial [Kofleriaceae bacterium]|nr:hypothetical protein [Kofleriaceae bacterium]
MAQSGVAGSGPRRSMLVGSTSFALHGAAVGVVVAFVGKHIDAPAREHGPTPIEVVSAAPAPPPEVARRAQPVPPVAT